MHRAIFGTLLAFATTSPLLGGEAAVIARGRTIEATVSPSGKVVSGPAAGADVERVTEGAAQGAICPAANPLSPNAARDLVEKVAFAENFYPEFVLAVARAESHFHSDAISSRGAIGLMQLEPETAKHYEVNICDPADNVRGGVRFLRDLHNRYRNPLFILAAYNAGEKALTEHGGVPPFPETVSFVAAVVNDFYDWPKIVGRKAGSPGAHAAASPTSQREENSKDEHWRSGFVWNVEPNEGP
jgi:hypothetical protein